MNSPWWAHMHVNPVRMALLLAAAAPLAACSGISVKPNPTPPNYIADKGDQYGSLSNSTNGLLGDIFGKGKPENGTGSSAALGVNAYLWRGALDTLSFMPLASADPFGGVIITDWYTPPSSPDERFKATAYILGRELRSDGVRISIFRQVMQDGHWVDAPVSKLTVGDIENKVLARARQLREQSQASL